MLQVTSLNGAESDFSKRRRQSGRFPARETLPPARGSRKAVPSDVGYITKQRDHLSPEFEADIRKQGMRGQKSGGPIPGTRWTATKEADALLALPSPITRPIPVVENRATEVARAFETGAQVRELRDRLGMTQERLAIRLGINRSHIANIERGHDSLSLDRRRMLQDLVEKTGTLAG